MLQNCLKNRIFESPDVHHLYPHRSVCFYECVGPAASSLESSIKWGDGFLIMYSVTNRSSFEAVSRLKRLIDHVKQTLGKAKTRSDFSTISATASSHVYVYGPSN